MKVAIPIHRAVAGDTLISKRLSVRLLSQDTTARLMAVVRSVSQQVDEQRRPVVTLQLQIHGVGILTVTGTELDDWELFLPVAFAV